MTSYQVTCSKCYGEGRVMSLGNSLNDVLCSSCNGHGFMTVIFKDGVRVDPIIKQTIIKSSTSIIIISAFALLFGMLILEPSLIKLLF